MGLKTKNYEIKKNGITIPEAYAQINQITISEDGICYADFKIQQTRDSMSLGALDRVCIDCKVDKSLPIYEQVYTYAKETVFTGWEDDIVESITMVSESD